MMVREDFTITPTIHVATEAEPILSHLFGAEFGLEILLETGRLSSQLFF